MPNLDDLKEMITEEIDVKDGQVWYFLVDIKNMPIGKRHSTKALLNIVRF